MLTSPAHPPLLPLPTTTTTPLLHRMLADPTGRRILRDRPRITTQTLSLARLRSLPPNTLGWAYAAGLDREGGVPGYAGSGAVCGCGGGGGGGGGGGVCDAAVSREA